MSQHLSDVITLHACLNYSVEISSFFINRYREKYICSEGACTWDISKEHYFSFVKTKVYLHHAGWPSQPVETLSTY